MTELLQTPLVRLVELLRTREISAYELMQATLARSDAEATRLNAFTLRVDAEELLREARTADQRLDAAHARPLEGIPLAVKDLENVAGLVTSYGSLAFRSNLAGFDSIQVARLKAAGAIVVGKTNVSEFGYTAFSNNRLFGATRNPWNPRYTAGGSSGGAAAAIAGGLVPMVTASDGGGSIRLPAAFCGCVGMKPSYGRIARAPNSLWVMNDTSVDGPLTRTVADAALQLELTAGAHALDPNSLREPRVAYHARLTKIPKRLRIGFSKDLGYAVVQADVQKIFEEALQIFAELGHELVAIETPAPDSTEIWIRAAAFDLAALLHEYLPARASEFGSELLAIVQGALAISAQEWAQIRKRREELNQWCAQTFAAVDLLLTPTAPCDPPAAEGPLPDTVEGRRVAPANLAAFTIPFNLSWNPAISVPAGISRAGLPVGVQLVAARGRDELVLQAAYAFEQATPRRSAPPASRT